MWTQIRLLLQEQFDLDQHCLLKRLLKHFSRRQKQTTFVVIGDLGVNVPFQTQLLLTEYLDVKNTEKSRQQVPSSFDEPNVDIGVYFAKKKQLKSKKVGSLFIYVYKDSFREKYCFTSNYCCA